ncbi:MAG: hypothetical protein H6733_05695 [Alphaproteobacteria bacterium]|nr:hypothetical protein [Alphaproteobacteria bacterium]
MTAPLPLPADAVLDDFVHEALYDPSAWFVHRVLAVEPDAQRLVAEMDTTRLALVDAQRVVPGHPKHVPAAIAVQATGTLGHLYAVYALGLRTTEGWVGFGTHIHKARWGKMGRIGPPMWMEARCDRTRVLWGTRFCDFSFRFEQDGETVYTSRQTAAWRQDQAGQS